MFDVIIEMETSILVYGVTKEVYGRFSGYQSSIVSLLEVSLKLVVRPYYSFVVFAVFAAIVLVGHLTPLIVAETKESDVHLPFFLEVCCVF